MRRGNASSKNQGFPIRLGIFGGKLGFWGSFNPTILETNRMIGGAELAMIHVSHGLAKLGYDVTVFYSDVDKPGGYNGVEWRNVKDFDPQECWDVLIAWDSEAVFGQRPCAHLKILELQCNHPRTSPGYRIDWYTPKSEWHKRRICQFNELIPPERCYIMPNGVDLSRYAKAEKRIPGRVIWSSSPDRGLHHLLRIWPRVRKEVPEATLHIFYAFDKNFEGRMWVMDYTAQHMWFIKTHIDQPGVVHRKGVGQRTLAREQLKAKLLAYPCDPPLPSEGFCITVLECLAAGTPALISDADCLPELYQDAAAMLPLPVNDDQWVESIVRFLTEDDLWQEYSEKGKAFAPRYSWDNNVERWNKFLQEKLMEARCR